MIRGKPSNWSAGKWTLHHSLVDIGSCILYVTTIHGCREGRARCNQGEWPCPWTGMKGKRLLWSDSSVLQACVLGLPLQGWKFDSESSVSRGNWDCSIPLPHRVRSWIFMIHNMVECKYIFYHVCVDRCLFRLVNSTRIWKLKHEIKDLLFVAFQQKKLQSLHKPFMSS